MKVCLFLFSVPLKSKVEALNAFSSFPFFGKVFILVLLFQVGTKEKDLSSFSQTGIY